MSAAAIAAGADIELGWRMAEPSTVSPLLSRPERRFVSQLRGRASKMETVDPDSLSRAGDGSRFRHEQAAGSGIEVVSGRPRKLLKKGQTYVSLFRQVRLL